MINKLLPLPLILIPLLTGCPELEELNRSSTSSPTTKVTVTAKRFVPSDCGYVESRTCKPDEYGLYYSDNTYTTVGKTTYDNAKIGDPR